MLRRNAACAALTCCTTFALLARTRPGATLVLRRGARPMAAASSLDLLGGLRDADGAPVDAAALAGARVGLYFAAGWCPMCTSFEPSLLEFRAAAASGESAESPVALVLVSSDGDAEAARAAFVARQPMGRLGRTEEIAQLALYLASDESAYTTGQMHVIDGGWTMA